MLRFVPRVVAILLSAVPLLTVHLPLVHAADPFQFEASELSTRYVLDDQLAWGHAIACANLDDDADEELIVGVRDDQTDQHRRGVRIYDPSGSDVGTWSRQLVDPGGVAVEDLTVADLDGDGRNDIIAVGRQTQNVKIYWNRK